MSNEKNLNFTTDLAEIFPKNTNKNLGRKCFSSEWRQHFKISRRSQTRQSHRSAHAQTNVAYAGRMM